MRGTGLGSGSGIPVDGRVFHVWTIEGSEALALSIYGTRGEALEAGPLGARRSRRLLSLRDTARAMWQENLELVRSIYAAWERGDFGETHWADPEIDCQFIGDTPAAGAAKGLNGMATAWREWLSAWQDFHVEADEYRELDGQRVLVLARFAGRGKTSGLEIRQVWTKAASVFHIHDGKVTKLLLYTDHQLALEALGLSE